MNASNPAIGISTARLILDDGISPALMRLLSVLSDTLSILAASLGLTVMRSSEGRMSLGVGDCQLFTWHPLHSQHVLRA